VKSRVMWRWCGICFVSLFHPMYILMLGPNLLLSPATLLGFDCDIDV